MRRFAAWKCGSKALACGAAAGFDPLEDLRYIWTFGLKIFGSNSFDHVAPMDPVARRRTEPVIDAVLPLDHAQEGMRRLLEREVFGKAIVQP